MDRSASRYLCYSSHRQPGLFLLFIFLLQFFVLSLIFIRQPGVTKIHFGFFVIIVYNFFYWWWKHFQHQKVKEEAIFWNGSLSEGSLTWNRTCWTSSISFSLSLLETSATFTFTLLLMSHSLRIISPEMRLVPLSDFPFGSQCPPEEIEVREIFSLSSFSMWILTGCVLQGV